MEGKQSTSVDKLKGLLKDSFQSTSNTSNASFAMQELCQCHVQDLLFWGRTPQTSKNAGLYLRSMDVYHLKLTKAPAIHIWTQKRWINSTYHIYLSEQREIDCEPIHLHTKATTHRRFLIPASPSCTVRTMATLEQGQPQRLCLNFGNAFLQKAYKKCKIICAFHSVYQRCFLAVIPMGCGSRLTIRIATCTASGQSHKASRMARLVPAIAATILAGKAFATRWAFTAKYGETLEVLCNSRN